MAILRCTPKVQFVVLLNVVVIFFAGAVIMLLIGVIMFEREYSAKAVYEQNTCEVMSSYYVEWTCSGGRGSSYVCYKPFWMVTYILDEERIDTSIDEGGYRNSGDAQKKLDEYQVGMSYSCWCHVVYPIQVRWNEPDPTDGLILLIFGGIATICCLISIFFTCRVRRKFYRE